jgi:hypothetical protein
MGRYKCAAGCGRMSDPVPGDLEKTQIGGIPTSTWFCSTECRRAWSGHAEEKPEETSETPLPVLLPH